MPGPPLSAFPGPPVPPYPSAPPYPPVPPYPSGPAYPPGLPPATSAPPAGVGPGPVVVQIGEITVMPPLVHTPAGDIPLAGSTWHLADYWQSEQKIPTWAIVCAIVGFCVLTVFSLLFLLVKETIQHGFVQVTVTNGPYQYTARIPVTHPAQVYQLNNQINYLRSLAAC